MLLTILTFTFCIIKSSPNLLPMKRIVIYPSDIRLLTDKSESYARKEIQNLKKVLNKEPHQKVTIREYCIYYGFNEKQVLEALSIPDLKNVC